MLEIQGLYKRYQDYHVLQDFHMRALKEKITVLTGTSGCGKSTLLRIICGLDQDVTYQQFMFDGHPIVDLWRKRKVALMFQNYALFPHLSVYQNIFSATRFHKAKLSLVDELVEMMQLQKITKLLPHQISGGQQQRVAMARAIVQKPQLLLMDEPMSALDKSLQCDLLLEMKGLIKKFQMTAIIVTHSTEQAFTLADEIIFMKDGKNMRQSTPIDIIQSPKSLDIVKHFQMAQYLPLSNDRILLYYQRQCIFSDQHPLEGDKRMIVSGVIMSLHVEQGEIFISIRNQNNELVKGHYQGAQLPQVGSHITGYIDLSECQYISS